MTKFNKLLLIGHVESKINKQMTYKLNIQNVLNYYQLAKLFNVSHLEKGALIYIERCFTMLVDTQHFLELDYTAVSKILASSGVLITSELEVYKSANKWLSHYIEERNKFAENLLLKVRLPLLSDETLKFLLNDSSSFTNNNACKAKLEEMLYTKDKLIQNNGSNYYTHRYCNQDSFNVLICGGYDRGLDNVVNTVNQTDGNKFEFRKVFPPMTQERESPKAVCSKADVYVFGGYDKNLNWIKSVEKFSPITNTWSKVAEMFDDRKMFCLCTFMDKILVIGGYKVEDEDDVTDTCLVFDAKDYNWKKVARMSQVRYNAACVVFEERIVVSGGKDNNLDKLNNVESYDVVGDNWSPMPNMTSSKSGHSLVVVRNKLFVIGYGTDTCEVFDSSSKHFVAIKSPQTSCLILNRAISIGNKIIAFQNIKSSIFCYDVDKDERSEESCEVTKNLQAFSCVKIPWL